MPSNKNLPPIKPQDATSKKKKKDKKSKKSKKLQEVEELDFNIDNQTEEVDVDFGLFEPFETDYHGVKNLFVRSFDWCRKDPVMIVQELANSACEQGNIGTIIKSDENVLGITTLLNLRQYKNKFLEESVKMLCKWLEKHCKPEEIKKSIGSDAITSSDITGNEETSAASKSSQKDSPSKDSEATNIKHPLTSLIHSSNIGLFLNERIVGLPEEELVPALHTALPEAIKWSQSHPDSDKEERPFYFFDYYLGLAKAMRVAGSEELIYVNAEEEAYVEASCYTKEIVVGSSSDGDEDQMDGGIGASSSSSKGPSEPEFVGVEYRVIFLLPAKKLDGVAKRVEKIVKESA